ncbi:glycoside hydrolase family 97 catalytic domain-containing protein [Rubrolithibacter danxiaensis]|uniref:glycoside hydrolase family 97 protein n=1 Tax=Rubrolithibacter danxiaensis TaxID=3390805 RepID=UPI003BF819FB
MKKVLLSLFSLLQVFIAFGQEEWSVNSPDKSLTLILSNAKGQLSYKVLSGNTEIVKPSLLGIETSIGSFGHNLNFVKVNSRKIDEKYELTIGKRKVNHALGNETTVSFKNSANQFIQIDLRAYNDGVAFRYHFPENGKSVTVTGENTNFTLPLNGKVWLQNYDLDPAYEGIYTNGVAIGTNAKNEGGWGFPALFQTSGHWLLLTESNLEGSYFGSHLQQNCENGVYKLAMPLPSEATGVGRAAATSETPFTTPWRTFIISKNIGLIVESNLVYHLSKANSIGNYSWVKPGRASWSWWGDHDSSRDFSKLKNFVDLANEMGWEYSLVDANWNIMEGGGTIDDLVKYAKEKNIGLLMWYNSSGPHTAVTEQPRDIMFDSVKRKEEFKKLRAWGVKGVKVDFFQSDKQNLIQLYHDILKDAAAEHILVNFHGCTLPRGWSRTYPNLMSMEAVRGAENYGWSNEFAQQAPVQNNILTYTRNVVGPMDYTPVTFSDYECCPHVTTNAQELALSVLFETGILHFADRAAYYQNLDNRIKEFLRKVPTTWDDTKFVQGEPGKETVIARKNGNNWYVAGASGNDQAIKINLKLPFLNGKTYKAILFSDGKAGREIKVTETHLDRKSSLDIDVLPHGGFTLVLSPTEKN